MCSKFFLLLVIFLSSCLLTKPQEDCDQYYKLYEHDDAWMVYNLVKVMQFSSWTFQKRKADYVFMGDSIIDRWNLLSEIDGGYNWMNDNNLSNVVNVGIYGHTTCDLIKRQFYHVDPFEPKFIVSDGGGNDILFGVNNEIIMRYVNIYIHQLRNGNPKARIVYLLLPPSSIDFANKRKIEINRQIRRSIQDIGNSCYVILDDFLTEYGIEGNPTKAEYIGDKIHFNLNAYLIVKYKVDNALNNLQTNGVTCFD